MLTAVDAPNTILQYKGKLTHRSWPQLPQEIIRLIATYYLYDLAVNTYCPQTWETRRLWPSRMVYTCIRDSLELEKHIMSVCPEWRGAVAKHPFWKQAVSLLDGNDYLLHHMVVHPKPSLNGSSVALPPPIYLSHYQHFRNIVAASCHVCRINYPGTNLGLTAAKKILLNSMLGTVHLCREHDRRRTHFCGLCLRDSFPPGHQDPVREYEMTQAFGILENEDEDTWAGVEATCKKCRMEWLWRRASHSLRDQEAIGGPNLQSSDWETRQCIEGFLDLAEGTIAEVLTLAREKLWLKRYTKYESLGLHALAAQKSHGDDRGQEDLEEEYVEEDSEEDKELMLMKDANQVRELALHDWARQRILDGHWISPADIWYHHQVPGQPSSVQAVHPLPWAREGSEVGTTSGAEEDEEHTETQHPHPAIVAGEVPPTYQLCEQAYAAHLKQMREILLHPLRNVVRKIIMECSIPTAKGYEDPGLRARRMTLEEVVSILREEEGVWYEGVDWIERRRNEEEEERRLKEAQLRKRKEKEYDEDSSIAASSPSNKSTPSSTHTSSSSHSNATSPVLSTTTLQTTPSPPPSSDGERGSASKKDEEGSAAPSQRESESESDAAPSRPPPPSRPRIIPVDPVRSPPQLLSSIPHIPVTTAHLPQFSLEALRSLWRDACAPLYHCRCSVCERAKLAESAARAAYAAANAPTIVSSQYHYQQQQQPVRSYPPIAIRGNINSDNNAAVNIDAAEIELKEVSEIELDGEGEEEVDYDGSDLEYDDEEEEEEDDDDLRYAEYRYSVSPEAVAEVDVVDLISDAEGDHELDHEREQAPSPRPRKRSCDELEQTDAQVDALEAGQDPDDNSVVESPFFRRHDRREHGTPPKRARLGDIDREPVSPLEEDGEGLAGGDVDGDTGLSTFPIGGNHDPTVSPAASPTRLRKRSSEELEDGPDDQQHPYVHAHGLGAESGQGPPGSASNKRAKVDHSTSLVASPASLASELNGEGEDRSALGVGLGGKGKAACSPAPPGAAVAGTLLQVEEVSAEREDEEYEEEIDKPYVPPRMWSRTPSQRAGPTG